MPAPAHAPPSPVLQPSKRARQSSPDKDSPASLLSGGTASPINDQIHDGPLGHGAAGGSGNGSGSGNGNGNGSGNGGSMAMAMAGKIGQSSNFRNVSACNRCRLRKNRCDQKLPSCASCDKAGVACVGYDPITKREIPRSYIFYLEKRVEQLEGLLAANNLPFPSPEHLDYCSKSGNGSAGSARSPTEPGQSVYSEGPDNSASSGRAESNGGGDGSGKLQRIALKPGSTGGPAPANTRYLGSTSGISFARVVFAAVQSSVSDQKSNSDKGGVRPYKPAQVGSSPAGTSMRDSFFGLHTKPTIHPATFPDRELGQKLVTLFFEHANPQMPVLHKGDFAELFERAYATEGRVRGPRELYVLNMVYAIGAGIIVGDSKGDFPSAQSADQPPGLRQCQPEEYHASAIVHLEACLGSGGGLEDLQAVLLLANFALLRPVPPGLWYIIGVAMRLAVDLGLQYEDGKDIETGLGDQETLAKERGRREYVRDMRRRLWWCTYSYDRLVSICVGRPFSISDQAITTEFPSLLEDRYITQGGFAEPPAEMQRPTYKLVAHHYFRLRLLQSEILQVLQFRQAQSARARGQNYHNPYIPSSLPLPFLFKFDSFRSWRIDIDRRLWEWKNSAPKRQDTGVAFSTEFLDLNYWQAIIMLYRQSLSVPTVFEGEYDTAKEVNSPPHYNTELREDEDRVYLKVAEAGQKILRLYRQLHLVGLVNYTYLTTHHLFVAGISYLYAIWHSPIVRSRLSMDEVDFTILAATSVFTDFMDKCPPAEACRDAFDRTVKATLKMVNASGGFGQQYHPGQGSGVSSARSSLDHSRVDWSSRSDSASISTKPSHHHSRRHHPPPPPSIDASTLTQTDAYSTSASPSSLLSAFQKGAQYRLSAGAAPGATSIKSESDPAAGFAHLRNLPLPPRSNASSATDNNNNNNPVTPDGKIPADVAAAAAQLSSPVAEGGPYLSPGQAPAQTQAQQQQMFSPGAMSFTELQGMEFLRDLNPTATAGGVGNGAAGAGVGGGGGIGNGSGNGVDFSGLADTQMDLGFGLGWEGLHHDYSEGQQLDLFDGFFFGGAQQGGGGGNGG